MSDPVTTMKQRFFNEHLPKLKTINEYSMNETTAIPKQPKLQSSSLFPPIDISSTSGSSIDPSLVPSSRDNAESPPPGSITTSLNTRQKADRFFQQHSTTLLPALSVVGSNAGSTTTAATTNVRSKPFNPYAHIKSKINTGRPGRSDTLVRHDPVTHQLEPTRRLNWKLLKQELEQDPQLRAQAKRLEFNPKTNYSAQLTTLSSHVRNKIKNFVTSTMGSRNERYKIIANATIFPSGTAGLHILSRCLWNPTTDNSITFKLQGVDCDVLIVAFLCYTELGPQ